MIRNKYYFSIYIVYFYDFIANTIVQLIKKFIYLLTFCLDSCLKIIKITNIIMKLTRFFFN